MLHGRIPMRQAIIDALAHDLEQIALHVRRDVLAEDITAEWQGQAGLAFPPFPQIENLREARLAIGELTLVNDQARRRRPAFYCFEDLIEGDDDVIEAAQIELHREIGARHL